MDKNKKLFPQKLWELIHNPSIQHCLRWSQDGQRVYLNRNEFEAYYLKTPNNQFHTQKAISFVRQMNMYGFRKVDDCYYENDNFKKNCPRLLKNMIRRHSNRSFPSIAPDNQQIINNNLCDNNQQLAETSNPNIIINTSTDHHQQNEQRQQQQQLHLQQTTHQQQRHHQISPILHANIPDQQTSNILTAANPAIASSLYLRLAALNQNPSLIAPTTYAQHNDNNNHSLHSSHNSSTSSIGLGCNQINNNSGGSQAISANTTISNSSNSSISNGSFPNIRVDRSPIINNLSQTSPINSLILNNSTTGVGPGIGDFPLNLQNSLTAQQLAAQQLIRSLLNQNLSGGGGTESVATNYSRANNYSSALQAYELNLLLETLLRVDRR